MIQNFVFPSIIVTIRTLMLGGIDDPLRLDTEGCEAKASSIRPQPFDTVQVT